jgi:hypothetical protein
MFPSTSIGKFSLTAVFSAVLLLAGCGGNDASSEKDAVLHVDHTHETAPQPAPAPVATETAPAAAPQPVLAAETTLVSTETITLAPTYTNLVKTTFYVAPYWPVWPQPIWPVTGKVIDGVGCFLTGVNHSHALISIYKNGVRLGLPGNIGRPDHGCYHALEMHVHDATGIIHMETDIVKKFKLGQFFSVWGQPLSRTGTAGLAGPVRFYVIEKGIVTRFDGNPYDIDMLAHREILIISGTEMSVVPRYQWPSGL